MNDPRLFKHPLGFLQVLNPPSTEELFKYYAQTYYQNQKAGYQHVYPDLELEVIGLRIQRRVRQALSLRQNKNPGKFLDVGCGEGFLLKALSELGWDVSGIDFSIAGVQRVNPDMTKHVSQGDVFKLLDERITHAKTYELVWLGNVLEHVLEPVELLRSLRKLVSENGVLVVTVPNDGSAYHEMLFQEGLIDRRWWIAIPDHISYFTKDSLKNLAKETGWNCAKIQGDFPVDIFLSHPGSNYVSDPTKGPEAHRARLRLELIIAQAGIETANNFYNALSDIGLGRDLTAFLLPRS